MKLFAAAFLVGVSLFVGVSYLIYLNEPCDLHASAASTDVDEPRYKRCEAEKAAIRNVEPRDTPWADSMELQIRQHIGTRFNAVQFDKLVVNCRTTFCELRAQGTVVEDGLLFRGRGDRVPDQPWATQLMNGEAGGSVGGSNWNWHYLFRRVTEEE